MFVVADDLAMVCPSVLRRTHPFAAVILFVELRL
jgi:hypothetical protein